MTFAEWASEQPNPISLPAIVSSTDLFDGELFGDELIDIYNSSVGDGSDDIHLPDHKHKEVDEDHPMDDGLGAFRPSTSFNDLTVLPLLPPPSEADHAVTDTKIQALPKTTKKRGIQHNVEVPAAKRKATAPRGARRPTTKKVPGDAMLKAEVHPAPVDAVTSAALIAANEASKEEDTPNPLVPDVAASAANAAEDIVTDGGDDESLDKEPTEADFKSIAQAAVSNLIMSVSGTKTEESTAPSDDKEEDLTVDLSTAHIKALTGNNWVAACSNSSVTNSECSPVGGDSKANNRVRRQNLTADERAQQNRDRNREHARNTRLRKKAYVEELKRTLTELVAQRDVTDAEKRQSAQRELEQREVRFRVTEEFLKLRGRNEGNFARWSAILEEGFMLTLPVLNVYKMGKGETSSSGITLCGVSNVMEDAKNFSAFLQKSKANDDAAVAIQYKCDRKHFFMDGCNAFLEWTATATGSGKELSLKGVIRCVFSPASNKLVSACLIFDGGALVAQLGSKPTSEVTSPQETLDEAAQAAANEADAILDSLQMPQMNVLVPSNMVSVVPSSSASEGSLDKGDSCDESFGDHQSDKQDSQDSTTSGMTTRRVQRRDH